MTTAATVSATARVELQEVLPASPNAPVRVRVTVPGTAYRLDFVFAGDAAMLQQRLAARGAGAVRLGGTVRGRALRAWQATAGGCFIEPVWGTPRIVQGRVLAIDVNANAVLIDLAVPAWIEMEASQPAGQWQTGDMLNFYVESGMTFTPSA
ncbi:MAG: hypothetical protein ACOYO7_06265 [Phycisphaerales bacterium]|jgi:hypothetical protein